MMSIVPYAYIESLSEDLYEIEDRMACCGLTHYASYLMEKCFHDRHELEQSLQKAAIALKAANEPVSHHFRTVFLSGDELMQDWMISDLGLRLLLINADVSNPVVARMLLRMVAEGFEH